MTPEQLVDDKISDIEKWISVGSGIAYQFNLDCDDDFGRAVAEELDERGYAAKGQREYIRCQCDDCNGKARPAHFVITVHRRYT